MGETQAYWCVRGAFVEKCAAVAAMPREQLEGIVIDERYNSFLRDVADIPAGQRDLHGRGKRIPYIGWFWRHVQFSSRCVPIGDCGSFIGFMENNKWDHPERNLTPEEFDRVISLIDAAMAESEQGGGLDDIINARNTRLDELWAYLQTLEISNV